MDRDGDDARRVIGHRIRTHEAALACAAALGWPSVLAPQVEETRARLREARAILAALETGIDACRNGA